MNKVKFIMPTKSDLASRSSTINNAFAIAITPYIRPNDEDLIQYYDELRITPKQCGYCLQRGTSVDHINPLVKNGLPTGYITDINNLIPCCPSCNSRKGAKDFRDWYLSEKNVSRLHALGLSDDTIQERYSTICHFIDSHTRKPIDYKSIVGEDKWDEYIQRKSRLIELLKRDQQFCDELAEIIRKHLLEENRRE